MEYKVVMLGGGFVGKSAMTIRFITNNFLTEYEPTIEDSYRKQTTVDGEPALIDVLDTAGQEEFGSMRDQWIKEGDGFLLIYDITKRYTLDEIKNLFDRMVNAKDTEDIPVVICGNKCDLEESRVVSIEQGQEMAARCGRYCTFVETSARSNIRIQEVFSEIVRKIRLSRNPPIDPQLKKKSIISRSFCQIL